MPTARKKPKTAPPARRPEALLAPSLLAGNHARLAESLRAVEEAGCRWVHLDIMDGHFVPNLSFGPQTVANLRQESDLFFDVHLMLSEPHRYIDAFLEAGANLISIHVEPDYAIAETLQRIRRESTQTGIVIKPDTAPETVLPFLEEVDLVLVMTVEPGFGGQAFRREMLPKIAQLAQWREELKQKFRIEVDGGVGLAEAADCANHGADTFVTGTSFFKAADRTDFRLRLEGEPPQ